MRAILTICRHARKTVVLAYHHPAAEPSDSLTNMRWSGSSPPLVIYFLDDGIMFNRRSAISWSMVASVNPRLLTV